MSPLSSHECERVLTALDDLLAERERIVELLTELPKSWVAVRTTLNELTRVIHADKER